MNMKSGSAIVSLFLLPLYAGTVLPQPASEEPAVRIGSYSIITRMGTDGESGPAIVDMMAGGNIGAGCNIGENVTPPPRKTISFTVPLKDIGNYSYRVARLRKNGSGMSSANVDEYGVIQTEVMDRQVMEVTPCGIQKEQNPSFREEDEEYYYLVAQYLDTGIDYYTLDLRQIYLTSFINSLQMSKNRTRFFNPESTETYGRQRMEVRMHNRSMDTGLLLSVYGTKLTLEEVLDEIYLETGCYVSDDGEWLVIESC